MIKEVLFIACCVIAIGVVVVYSLVASALFKREQANKNPYYYCESDWICCGNADNCDVNLKSFDDHEHGVKTLKATGDIYPITDKFGYGSAYHQNCVLPVTNALNNYTNGDGVTFNFTSLYNGGYNQPGNPSIYTPGCGPGATAAECLDPKKNPQNPNPVCPYISIDAPPNDPVTENNLPSGYNTNSGGAIPTLNTEGGWYGASNQQYVGGSTPSGSANGYICPPTLNSVANTNVSTFKNNLYNNLGSDPLL